MPCLPGRRRVRLILVSEGRSGEQFRCGGIQPRLAFVSSGSIGGLTPPANTGKCGVIGMRDSGGSADRRIVELVNLISSEYQRPLTREVLARHVNLSPSRLHCLFRRHTGTTPHAAITAKRMEKAAELLRMTHLLVKEIAAKVGIQDDSHFVRDFEKAYGLSPTAYREAQVAPAAGVVPGIMTARACDRTHRQQVVVLANKGSLERHC